MIYTAIDTFYLSDEQLKNSPSSKDGIDEVTETTLRIYGCDLIQESGILLKLPQAVMATGQVLFHRFYCKKSFARFNVKRVAASCVWLASKLEESPRKARQVLIIFHRMECRRENLPIEHLDISSKKYVDLKADLIRTERHLLKEMGFICHVEHPHKFISNYLATLETPPELRQEAWNLANDSLRTTLCVRFKSEVVACGVVYAAARRFQVPLPENPPWWKAFDADKSGIDEVCRCLAHLYSIPMAQYIPVCKEGGSFATSNRLWESPMQSISKDGSTTVTPVTEESGTGKGSSATVNTEAGKDEVIKAALGKLKESKKSDDESKSASNGGESREEPESKLMLDNKSEAGGERIKERDRDKERERKRTRSRDIERGRESDRERGREDSERDRDRAKERSHRSRDRGKDSGRREKSNHILLEITTTALLIHQRRKIAANITHMLDEIFRSLLQLFNAFTQLLQILDIRSDLDPAGAVVCLKPSVRFDNPNPPHKNKEQKGSNTVYNCSLYHTYLELQLMATPK